MNLSRIPICDCEAFRCTIRSIVIDSVLLIGGARAPDYLLRAVAGRVSYIATADSGLDHARELGLAPDLICGDMDSVSDPDIAHRYPEAQVHQFGREKDETDTEIGLRFLREAGFVNPVIFGGGASGRPDHYFGILWTFERNPSPRGWIDSDAEMVVVEEGDRFEVRAEPGTILSCFPVGRGPFSFMSDGLRWPLHGLQWERETSGMSNIVDTERISISVAAGRVLIVRPFVVDSRSNGPELVNGTWRATV